MVCVVSGRTFVGDEWVSRLCPVVCTLYSYPSVATVYSVVFVSGFFSCSLMTLLTNSGHMYCEARMRVRDTRDAIPETLFLNSYFTHSTLEIQDGKPKSYERE